MMGRLVVVLVAVGCGLRVVGGVEERRLGCRWARGIIYPTGGATNRQNSGCRARDSAGDGKVKNQVNASGMEGNSRVVLGSK